MKHLFGAYNKYLRPEFFPQHVTYMSVYIYAFLQFLKHKDPLWFTATNPGFPLGGLYPSSKREHLMQIAPEYVPATIYIDTGGFTREHMLQAFESSDLSFPLIIKPDNGLRGLGIEIFHTREEFDQKIDAYITEHAKRGARLLQEFIDYPLEIGVFYVRLPGEEKGSVTGIVGKEFLDIIGDGTSTFEHLVHTHPRARYHIEILEEQFAHLWSTVLADGEVVPVVEIGTHSRGSTFVDKSEYISPELTELFDQISHQVDGFYYGRFDVRAESIQGVLDGTFKIMEINPTYGEPTWMYDPQYSFFTQQKILLEHRSLMSQVAQHNIARGVQPHSLSRWKEAREEYVSHV